MVLLQDSLSNYSVYCFVVTDVIFHTWSCMLAGNTPRSQHETSASTNMVMMPTVVTVRRPSLWRNITSEETTMDLGTWWVLTFFLNSTCFLLLKNWNIHTFHFNVLYVLRVNLKIYWYFSKRPLVACTKKNCQYFSIQLKLCCPCTVVVQVSPLWI